MCCYSVVFRGVGTGNMGFLGQIRHRSEIDQKDFNSDTNGNVFHLLRSRFAARYLNDDVTVYLQLQDSRFFGEAIEARSMAAPTTSICTRDTCC